MATEANIQESVCLKKGEREENALTSENFEEKVTELPGNQVKQLETSSLVATTVYTPLESGTGKPTDESGTFFQALSVTMVIADEHSNTPESYKAAKPTEPEEKTIKIGEKAIESEVYGKDVTEKAEPEVGLKLLDSVEPSKKEPFNTSEKNQGDGDGVTSSQDAACEDIKETTEEHAAIVADFKEQDLNETAGEIVKDDKSVDAQEANEQSDIGSKDTGEQKFEESVKKIEQDEEIEEIKLDVEIAKKEQNGLLQAITPDACASTQTIPQVETTEHEEKEQVVNVLEKDQDENDVTRAQEVTVEGGLQEKTHHNDDNEREVIQAKESVEEDANVCVSTQTTLVKESIKTQEPDDEKANEKEACEANGQKKAELDGEVEISDSVAPSQKETLSTIKKDQGGTGGVTSLQEPPCVDVEETTTVQRVTTAIDFKEQDLNEKSREFVKEENEDKSLDAQEASDEYEKGTKEEIVQNPDESVKKFEKEEETEEIKPSVEIEEKKEQHELLPAITADDCITTETTSQVEKTEHEEENTQKDEGLKEKSDSPSIEEVCEETSPEKKDSATETVTKDENEDVEKEQEVNVLETHEGKVDVTSAQDGTIEKDLQEKDHQNEDDEREVVTTEESTEKDTEVIRSSETTEQQMLTNAAPSDVCISTQTEPEEEATEKNDVEVLNENETVRKDEDQEKEQEIYVTEKVQSGGDNVTSSENTSNEQEQLTEEIKPSVETTEEKDVCISTQIESQEKATKNEENAIHDDDQKEKSDNPSVNEVCEESNLKKTESEEEIKLSDGSVVTTRESVTETTEETKSSDETKENIEQQGVLNVVTRDNGDGQIDKHESPLVEVVCEETSAKTAEPEEVKHSDSSSTKLNEKETLDKEENLEKEDDIKNSEVQGGGDDVTSSQNASNEGIEEATIGQHDTNVACVEEGEGVIAKPKEILIEEAEDKLIDAEELGQPNEQNVEETHPTISENPEDEIKKEDKDFPHESVEDTNDDTTKDEKCTLEQEPVKEHTDQDKVSTEKVTDLNETKEVETKEEIIPSPALSASTEATSNSEKENPESEKLPTEDLEIVSEEQILELVSKSEEPVLKETETHVDEEKGTVTKEISSAEIPLELAQPSEQNVEEAHSHLGKIITENPEDEIKKEDKELSHETVKDTNDDTTKEEKCTLEQEPIEVLSGQDEVSKEKVTDLNETTEVEPKEEITPSTSLETSTEDTPNTEKEKAESENLPIEDLKTVSEVQIPESVPELEEPTLKEKCVITETERRLDEEKRTVTEEISSDEKTQQTTEIKQETVKEVCEEANSEKAELEEEIKHSDSSDMKINEKEITFKDDNEEKEVNMSTESRSEDNLTSSLIEVSEEKEDLKEKNIHNEGNEGDFIKSGEDVGEDTEESTEHVTATDVCGSTQIETREETIENEEKNGEKAIEHEEYEAVSREENLEKKQEDVEETKMGEHATTNEEKDVCISTQSESQEEPAKDEEIAIERDGEQKEKSENAVVKEVCEENELPTTESEGRQMSDSFEVKTRENAYEDTEETKEDIQQQGVLNVITSDVSSSTQTETIEKSTASEENNDVETTNDDGQTEKPESPLIEVVCETTKSEIVESEEGVKQSDILSTTLNENETLSKEEKLEKEDEIKTSEVEGGGVEPTSSQNASGEDVKETTIDQHNTTVAHVEEVQSVSASPKEILVEETEDKDKSIDAEEVSLELVQPNEQNAEETLPCLTKSISDNLEDEIKKEDTNDNAANEDKHTLEYEPVEERSSQDEVSKETVTGLNETKEVEPHEDTPSISVETSTDDTSKTISEVQIAELVTNTEESVQKNECFISETETHLDEEKSTITEEIPSDEKTELTTEIKQETVKEVCEETSSEKTELEEGLKLLDSSNVKINEKEITTFKEDEQEKSQEVNTSAESQGGGNMTSSQNEVSEEKEELKEKNYHNEGNEGDFIEIGESVDEDTREIISSVETKDSEAKDTEHVISTSSSTHTEHDEEAIEKDEKKDETAIENDKNEIVSTEENLEKKQEDIKETNTGEHATTVAYFEEEGSLSTITKEAIGKAEEGDKSVIVQEKTEQYEEENVEKEQKAEEYNDEIKPSVETTEEKDVCISTQTESHVEPTKKEENAIGPDGERKENPDNPFVKEVCEESDLTKTESDERQLSDSFDVNTREDTEETKSSDETKENKEQQGVFDVITTDVSSSTQIEHAEKSTASHEENNDEETIEQDKGQTEKPEIPSVAVACETTKSEIVESEEEVKQSDSFSTTLNDNEILSKEEKLEKEDEIKTSEIKVGEVEVTSSQNASNDDIKETTLDQDTTTVAHVEEGSGVSALPKEILIEEAEDKSVDAEEISFELGQPNEQNVEETLPCPTKSISNNPEDEIKKEDRDLSHESVEDTNDDTKEEGRTLEHENVKEHSGQDEVSKEKVTDLHETTEVELKEDITPSISLETSTEDASYLEKENLEVETSPIENLETVSEVQIPESVPRSEETVLKKECLISETETHFDEEKETITEKNSTDKKTEQTTEIKQETVKEVCEEITGEVENKSTHAQEVSKEIEQTKEQNVEETEACLTETISEKTEAKITKDEDTSQDCIEHINENITTEVKCFPDVITKEIDISTLKHEPVEEQNDSQDEVSKEILTDSNETIAVEPKEDITSSSSLGTSAEDTLNSDKAKTVSESLPLEDLESVSEVHIPDVTPKSEDLKMEEECLVSEIETFADEGNRVATKEISSDENLETHGSTQQPEKSYSTTENQLNSTEDCLKTEKDVILTKEIEQVPLEIEKEKEVSDFKDQIVEEDTYSPELEEKSAQNQKETVHEISSLGSISVENPEVTEVNVDAQIGQKDLQSKEDISCVSKLTNDIADQEPKEEKSPSVEDDATVESVDLSNTESTAYPSESEKLATRALESDCDVQIPEVVADSEDSKVKEECIVLATTAENSVEEQDTKTNEISSAPDKEHVTKANTESDLIIEEKTSTKENHEIHRELEPTSEPAIEDPVTIETKPQSEQLDITSENITNDQTSESKLEHTSAKDTEEDVTLAPEIETKGIENLHETTKNIILTDEVAVETEKEKERNEIEKQVSEEDNCPTELDSTPTPVQKELVNEIEYSKPIPVGNTEVTEVKAESQTEVENTQAAEDLSCLPKASSGTEKIKAEICEDPQQTITVIGEVRETIEEQDALTSQLADREILEEKDDKPISELQNFSEDQKSIIDIINEEVKLTQLTSDTDVFQIETSSSRTGELLEAKDSVEDTEDAKFTTENLSVKDETITESKKSNEDSEIVASEFKKLEDTVTEKEKETLDEPRTDDSEKTTYDSILSSEIATEAAKIVPECRNAPAILTDNLPEASPEMLLAKPEDKITEDPEVLTSVEKDVTDVKKHEKDLDHETEVKTADVVSNVECSEIEPRHLDTNQVSQKDQKKEADESIKDVIPVEDVKTSTRELEVGSVDLEVPSVIDATADNANYKTLEVHEAGLLKDDKHLESACEQSKSGEEGSGIKQEPLKLDASGTLGTAAAEDLKISQKYVTDDLINVSQTHPEVQNREVPDCTVDKQSPKESTESKILTEKIDSSHEQAEPVAKSLVPEAGNLKVNTTVSLDQKEKSESVEKEETGVKTDDEDEEEEDHEEDEKTGPCSDAPVMVEASQDMEVKAHKKSHNIISGVGSKVKHSIAKVKKAITGKSSPTKSTSPKAKNQVTG